jgi:hypothetical protein
MTDVNTVSFQFVFGQGVLFGLLAFFGILAASAKASDFLRNSYWKWLAAAFAYALLGLFGYMAIQDFRISFLDAATLNVLRVGSWHVATGYGFLGGVVLGGMATGVRECLRGSRR